MICGDRLVLRSTYHLHRNHWWMNDGGTVAHLGGGRVCENNAVRTSSPQFDIFQVYIEDYSVPRASNPQHPEPAEATWRLSKYSIQFGRIKLLIEPSLATESKRWSPQSVRVGLGLGFGSGGRPWAPQHPSTGHSIHSVRVRLRVGWSALSATVNPTCRCRYVVRYEHKAEH